MSRERARRREARAAEVARADQVRARSQRRRAALRRLRPQLPDRRTGRLFARRNKAQRAVVALTVAVALTMIWLLVESLATRVALSALLAIGTPALTVLVFDRRNRSWP